MQSASLRCLNVCRHPAVNAVLFQVGWFVCVIGGNFAALAYTTIYLLFHFGWYSQLKGEWRYTVAIASTGIVLDSCNLWLGVFSSPEGFPLWLACLWLLVATVIPHGLYWLRARPLLAIACGAIGGAGSYTAGIQLGAASSENLFASQLIWLAQWAVLFPVLLKACDWIPGNQQAQVS